MHRRLWNRNELCGVFVLLAFGWQLIIGRSRLAAGFWQILDPETISDSFRALQAASGQ